MATIEDVRLWLVMSGVSHVVDSTAHGWFHTLCDTLTSCSDTSHDPGKRKCRRCMARLREARVATEPSSHA